MMKTAQDQLNEQYEMIDKLGQGAFGSIICIKSRKDGKQYACKIQKNQGKKGVLVEKQFLILVELMESKKFPLVYAIRKFPQNSFVIMEKLDRNLFNIMSSLNKPFSIKTIALLAQQLFFSLKLLHRIGYLHRDLKPENIMTTFNSHTVKIIDFGLSDTLAARKSVKLIGNVRFASRGAHLGESSKLDDIQQLLYVLYFLMLGKLPWQSVKREDIQKQINRSIDGNSPIEITPIYKMKLEFLQIIQYPQTSNLIKKAFYEQMHRLSKYIFSLSTSNQLNYELMEHHTHRLLAISGTSKGQCFDWCQKQCPYKTSYNRLWSVYDSQ